MKYSKSLIFVYLFFISNLSYSAVLTVTGYGEDVVLTIPSLNISETEPFINGKATFDNISGGELMYLGSVGVKNVSSSKISRLEFVEMNRSQSFGSSLNHDHFELWNEGLRSNNTDFLSLIFNPTSPNPDRLFIGDAPSSSAGSNNAWLHYSINGTAYGDNLYSSGSGDYAACQTFGFSNPLRCHGKFVNNINDFWFAANKTSNFRGVALRKNGASLANNRFFFRYGNVGFRPLPSQIPTYGNAPYCWEYKQNF